MQPENAARPMVGAEQLPVPPQNGGEGIPSLPPVAPMESAPLRGGERFEQAAEAGAQAVNAIAQAAPAMQVAPVPGPAQASPVQQDSSGLGTTPLVAADEDLIEKEWVDKAKAIVEHTKDDPYKRTQQVNELQRDYLQKRYGKVVGASE